MNMQEKEQARIIATRDLGQLAEQNEQYARNNRDLKEYERKQQEEERELAKWVDMTRWQYRER